MKRSLFYFVILLFSLVTVISSCSKKVRFDNSAVVPAAEGIVIIKKDGNNNYSIDLTVKNLAPSDKLTPPQPAYVVWVTTENNGIKNIGQLNSSTGWLSSSLTGSLQAVTAFRPKRVFITAEENPAIQHPGTQSIMTTPEF